MDNGEDICSESVHSVSPSYALLSSVGNKAMARLEKEGGRMRHYEVMVLPNIYLLTLPTTHAQLLVAT